jgi:hypothetical protein
MGSPVRPRGRGQLGVDSISIFLQRLLPSRGSQPLCIGIVDGLILLFSRMNEEKNI